MSMCTLVSVVWTAALAVGPVIQPDKPNVVSFPPAEARFVRFVIHASSGSQPCIDELEIYSRGGKRNLALASGGAKASASSCLPGYPIHKIPHLNDGRYGNSHSWISAGAGTEWAQVELPRPVKVARVVFSRDRKGRYRDRIPIHVEVRLSMDGKRWRKAAEVKARHPAPRRRPAPRTPPGPPQPLTWEGLLTYAFTRERDTWRRLSARDHLSPLRVERPATPGGEPYWGRIARLKPLDRVLVLMDEMAERLAGKGLDVSAERKQLADLRRRQAALGDDGAEAESLYLEARLAKRRLMLRDPDLAPVERILFAKRHPYWASHNYSDVLDAQFRPGGGICVLTIPRRRGRLEPQFAKLTVLFDGTDGIARDPVADFSGKTIYFAYRPKISPTAGRACYWHVMAMQADGSGQKQVTDGPFHDHSPCPLPDGGLAFISTRCKARFLCWRPQAFVLFRMEVDGSAIRPLSFANLSEWTPTMMRDGRILWTRSEYVDKGANFGHTLWAIRTDGTHPELIYGNNTINCYINAHEVPHAREMVCTIFSHGGDHNGPVGLIDRSKGPFDPAALTNITPDVRPHYDMSWPRYECFRDPIPVSRDVFLVSHAPGSRFGLYLIDRYGNREVLYMDPSIGSMRPSLLRARDVPPVSTGMIDVALAEKGLGEFSLADVYQGLAPAVPRGKVKYVRVCEEVRADLLRLPDGQYQQDHRPFQDWYATPIHKVRGPHGWPSYVAKASHGLAPVEADGSANFYAPAGKVLYFQALDADLNEVQRMRSVVQLQPGERRGCVGCHESRLATFGLRQMAAARPRAALRTPSRLDAPPWGAGPLSYAKAVQPVWDAHCIRCHNAKHKKGLNLTGTLDREKVPASYRTLIEKGWVHYFNWSYGVRPRKAQPLTFGTTRSKLIAHLAAGHNKVTLTDAQWRRIKCWIDLNCPLWGDYVYRPRRPAVAAAAR